MMVRYWQSPWHFVSLDRPCQHISNFTEGMVPFVLTECWWLLIHVNLQIINQINASPISLLYIKNSQTHDCNVKTSNGSFFVWWKIMFKVKYIFLKMKRIISIFVFILLNPKRLVFVKLPCLCQVLSEDCCSKYCKEINKCFKIFKTNLKAERLIFSPVWCHWNEFKVIHWCYGQLSL